MCNFALLAGEYGVFDSLWGFLMDPDAFSGIFKSLAMLGMYVYMSNASIWLLTLGGSCAVLHLWHKFEFSDMFSGIFKLSASLCACMHALCAPA